MEDLLGQNFDFPNVTVVIDSSASVFRCILSLKILDLINEITNNFLERLDGEVLIHYPTKNRM
jgi:hypothetical protein